MQAIFVLIAIIAVMGFIAYKLKNPTMPAGKGTQPTVVPRRVTRLTQELTLVEYEVDGKVVTYQVTSGAIELLHEEPLKASLGEVSTEASAGFSKTLDTILSKGSKLKG